MVARSATEDHGLRLADFHYHLPPERIAQRPPAERDGGRLMTLGRAAGLPGHHRVLDLPRLLPPGALLVVNDTRVMPARLQGRRPTGGQVELLLLERAGPGEAPGTSRWEAMARSSKGPRAGEEIQLGGGAVARVLEAPRQGRCPVELRDDALRAHGAIPLPPYIRRADDAEDRERYQTVYAREEGSVAAPTAGLHLSARLLSQLEQAGVELCRVTLHVGPGTFTPVRSERVEEHTMEPERYEVPAQAAQAMAAARAAGRAVIAVGTTVVRTLESTGGQAGAGRTGLFITPGHRFGVVDGLLTNFHLPGSTLLMLVAALAGRERVLAAYAEAVDAGYRFYSYGDAMLIT